MKEIKFGINIEGHMMLQAELGDINIRGISNKVRNRIKLCYCWLRKKRTKGLDCFWHIYQKS